MSGPFWAIGPLVGSLSRFTRAELPGSALMFVCPTAAAVVLVHRREPPGGVARLLREATRLPPRDRAPWYVPMVALMPLVVGGSHAVARALQRPAPDARIAWRAVPALTVLYVVTAAGEEVGWSAYATDPLQRRVGSLRAGVILGVLWAGLHVIPYRQLGHSWTWITWQALFTIELRVALVGLYNATGGRVTAPIVCHASHNIAWSLLPGSGSSHNPTISAPLMVAATAGISVAAGRRGT